MSETIVFLDHRSKTKPEATIKALTEEVLVLRRLVLEAIEIIEGDPDCGYEWPDKARAALARGGR